MNTIAVYPIYLLLLSPTIAFQYGHVGKRHASICRHHRLSENIISPSPLFANQDDENDAPNLDDDDWRSFRARLVLENKQGEQGASSSTTWAYDSGLIEPGSIILAKTEPDFCYFGLSQQYFHKAVLLVTYHSSEFTKGIILNRPTNLHLYDEDFIDENGEPFIKSDNALEDMNSWRIWFGGDVNGMYSDDPEIVCLHSIDSNLGKNLSEEIIKNIFLTNYEGARKLIDANEATSQDFWVFAGYCGWSAGQLLDELKHESWYMVSADSQTVWSELVRQRDEDDNDPRDAGLKTYSKLMQMIDKGHEAQELSESFADLTLKEWAAEAILFNSTVSEAVLAYEMNNTDVTREALLDEIMDSFSSKAGAIGSVDKIVKLALDAKAGKLSGALLRGSSAQRSPFLLSDQKFHKALILLLQDEDAVSVGVMLNHPTTDTHPITLPNGNTMDIIIRYGGSFGIPGVVEQPIIFLHCKSQLRKLGIGESVNKHDDTGNIWICSEEQVKRSISEGHATPRDFMAVRGLSIWNKEADEIEGGILGEILMGNFEVVDPIRGPEIWCTLISQAQMSIDTLDRNCRLASEAWSVAGESVDTTLTQQCVYDSTVKVAELSDDALRYWQEAFLLGGVISAGKYTGFE
jgi:putative transcriptional regulator